MIGLILLLAVVAAQFIAWALCKRAGQLDDAAGMGDEGGEP